MFRVLPPPSSALPYPFCSLYCLKFSSSDALESESVPHSGSWPRSLPSAACSGRTWTVQRLVAVGESLSAFVFRIQCIHRCVHSALGIRINTMYSFAFARVHTLGCLEHLTLLRLYVCRAYRRSEAGARHDVLCASERFHYLSLCLDIAAVSMPPGG